MDGPLNVKIVNSKQGKETYKYRNTKGGTPDGGQWTCPKHVQYFIK